MTWKTAAILGWGLVLMACTTALKYPYYGLGLSQQCVDEGVLLGVDGNGEFEENLNKPMRVCLNDSGPYDCVVMRLGDHERLETDLAACQADLKACEEQ